ncbi:NUDIX hydrolase [Streptomyces flaveolus]|uniref:hypothetical protein n=1 Tax=Streptomyces flaveolus TaxID=67297 RepID=UPI0037022973
MTRRPAGRVRREAGEKLGVTLGPLTHVFDACISPGSVTERLRFQAAPVSRPTAPATAALEEEGEDIDVREPPFAGALAPGRPGRPVRPAAATG